MGRTRILDRSGERIDMLLLEKKSDRLDASGHGFYLCRCDCGNTVEAVYGDLIGTQRRGARVSCGCVGTGYNTARGKTKTENRTLFQTAAVPGISNYKAELPKIEYCPNCKADNLFGSNFCRNCGQPILTLEAAIRNLHNTLVELSSEMPDRRITFALDMAKFILPLTK